MECETGIICLLILYIIWDVNYFIRCIYSLFIIPLFEKRVRITETTSITGICTSQDVDIFIRHMNNARYLRELDFARFHFYRLTGLYEKIRKEGGGAVQGATSMRYRRAIPIFNTYRIETKLVWWDEKAIYLEQKFITKDNFVRAIATSKQCVTKLNVLELMRKFPGGTVRPDAPEDLQIWLRANELSSQNLRKDK